MAHIKVSIGTKVRAYKLIAQSIPQAVPTKVTFPNETFDLNSEWSTVNSTFTAKEAGYYLVIYQLAYDSTAMTAPSMFVVKNNLTNICTTNLTNTSLQTIGNLCDIHYLNIGDTLEFYALHLTVAKNTAIGENEVYIAISNFKF